MLSRCFVGRNEGGVDGLVMVVCFHRRIHRLRSVVESLLLCSLVLVLLLPSLEKVSEEVEVGVDERDVPCCPFAAEPLDL